MPQDKIATAEDWDSDESSAVPGSKVMAAAPGRRTATPAGRERSTQSKNSNVVVRSKSRAPASAPASHASDSGYSSHASRASQATSKSDPPLSLSARAAVQAQPTPVAAASPTKSSSRPKPQPIRVDSARSTRAYTTTTTSPAPQDKDGRRCADQNCNDPKCGGSTNPERRYTLPERQRQQQQPRPQLHTQQHPAYSSSPSKYPHPAYSQYSQAAPVQVPPPNMMPPPATSRPRSGSTSRTRPVSIHGYNSMSYNTAPAGPPPSASAYYAYNQPAYPPQTSAYSGAMAPSPLPITDYPPPSPVVPASPSSPSMNTYGGYAGFTGQYSARQANPNVPGLEMPKPLPQPGLLGRAMSARRPPSERPPGRRSSVYIDDPESAESYSESDSEVDVEYEREFRRRDSRRESRATATAVVSSRRPHTTKYVSDPSVPRVRRESREVTRIKTAPEIDYPSSSEIGDSDRTARAVINRRDARESDRGSRRHSVSSKGSSTRTKPSSLSSVTDYSRVIVEGPNGRRTAYLSKEDQAHLIRQYQQQKLEDKLEEQRMRQEKIEAYQKTVSGQPFELTAENMKSYADRKRPTTSRVSGRSQKSSSSGSKLNDNGIKIESGGTVLHVYGDAKIEMRASEDGGPAHFVIGSATGKESSYIAGSKSSSNGRVGRPRGRREMKIREEDGYEPGL